MRSGRARRREEIPHPGAASHRHRKRIPAATAAKHRRPHFFFEALFFDVFVFAPLDFRGEALVVRAVVFFRAAFFFPAFGHPCSIRS